MSRLERGEQLVARLRYEPESGRLIWMDGQKVGCEAGSRQVVQRKPSHRPYVYVSIVYRGYSFAASHVVWRIVHGGWPEVGIDHRDGDSGNNRHLNLRLSTAAQNSQNRVARVDNTAGGLPGVSWHKLRGRWRASIGIGRRQVHLGLFDDPKEAHQAYLAAKRELHTFQPTPRTETRTQ